MAKIEVLKREVQILSVKDDDYICITDIARYKDAERTDYLISNWMRNRNTIEFLGIWEQINNPEFNPIEFDGIKLRIIYLLPDTKKFNGIPIAHPVGYKVICSLRILIPSNIGNADIVIVFDGKYLHLSLEYLNFCHESPPILHTLCSQ